MRWLQYINLAFFCFVFKQYIITYLIWEICNVLFCLHIFSAFTAFPHDIGSVWDSAEHLLALLFQLRSSNRRRRVTDWIFSVLRGRTDGSKVNRSDAWDWLGLNKTKWPHTVIHSFLYGAWHCKTTCQITKNDSAGAGTSAFAHTEWILTSSFIGGGSHRQAVSLYSWPALIILQ